MVSPEDLRERELERTLETYEYLLRKRDDMVTTQRFVIASLIFIAAMLMIAMTLHC